MRWPMDVTRPSRRMRCPRRVHGIDRLRQALQGLVLGLRQRIALDHRLSGSSTSAAHGDWPPAFMQAVEPDVHRAVLGLQAIRLHHDDRPRPSGPACTGIAGDADRIPRVGQALAGSRNSWTGDSVPLEEVQQRLRRAIGQARLLHVDNKGLRAAASALCDEALAAELAHEGGARPASAAGAYSRTWARALVVLHQLPDRRRCRRSPWRRADEVESLPAPGPGESPGVV